MTPPLKAMPVQQAGCPEQLVPPIPITARGEHVTPTSPVMLLAGIPRRARKAAIGDELAFSTEAQHSRDPPLHRES